MNRAEPSPGQTCGNASRCPLCGEPNDCQLCTAAAYKGPCWCASVQIREGLLERVPADLRNRACICRSCVEAFTASPQMTPRAGRM